MMSVRQSKSFVLPRTQTLNMRIPSLGIMPLSVFGISGVPFTRETYRPPAGFFFGHWVHQNTGLKCKPEAKLYSHKEAREQFCSLNMDKPDSAWTEYMGVPQMYEIPLKCPCEDKVCINILLRLRACMRLKHEVYDAISALE